VFACGKEGKNRKRKIIRKRNNIRGEKLLEKSKRIGGKTQVCRDLLLQKAFCACLHSKKGKTFGKEKSFGKAATFGGEKLLKKPKKNLRVNSGM